MRVMRSRLIGREGNEYWVLRSGWQNLWTRIVERDGLEVWLSQEVRAVRRCATGVTVELTDRSEPGAPVERTLSCDLLIVACPAPAALAFLDATAQEQQVFGALKPATFTSTLYTSTHQPGRRYLDSWFYELGTTQQHTLYSQRQTIAAGRPELADVPEETPKVRVAAQYGEHPVLDAGLEASFNHRMAQVGARSVGVIARKRFDYFYRFDQDAIQARFPWKIASMQGQNRTWFIGSSVSFESVNNVIEMNLRLLRQFVDGD
jgi:predicted NAD/FAD-binding protein